MLEIRKVSMQVRYERDHRLGMVLLTVAVLAALANLLPVPAGAQGFTIPEEVVLKYVGIVWWSLAADSARARTAYRESLCTAYGMLAALSRAEVSSDVFIRGWNTERTLWPVAGTPQIGTALYDDARTTAKVQVSIRLRAGATVTETRTGFLTLTKDGSNWRVLLSADDADHLRRLAIVSARTNPALALPPCR